LVTHWNRSAPTWHRDSRRLVSVCCQHKAHTSLWQISGGQAVRPLHAACCSRSVVVHWNLLLDDHCLMCRPLLPKGSDEDDVGFCNRITVEAGVTALPVRAVIFQHSTCVQITRTGMFQLQMLLFLPLWAKLIHGICSGMWPAEGCV